MEDITDEDYTYGKRVCKNFDITNFNGYHDLNVQSNILLADVFENFPNMFLEIYELDPFGFITASELPWQETLKKD